MSPLNRSMVPPMAAMFLVFMGVLAIFTFGFIRADNEVRSAIHDSCLARNAIGQNTNLLLDQLIAGAERSTAFKAEEKVERMAGWAALRQPLEECTPL